MSLRELGDCHAARPRGSDPSCSNTLFFSELLMVCPGPHPSLNRQPPGQVPIYTSPVLR